MFILSGMLFLSLNLFIRLQPYILLKMHVIRRSFLFQQKLEKLYRTFDCIDLLVSYKFSKEIFAPTNCSLELFLERRFEYAQRYSFMAIHVFFETQLNLGLETFFFYSNKLVSKPFKITRT